MEHAVTKLVFLLYCCEIISQIAFVSCEYAVGVIYTWELIKYVFVYINYEAEAFGIIIWFCFSFYLLNFSSW